MNKLNSTQIIKIIALIFIVSNIYTLTAMYPNYDSSFDLGLSTGTAFGHALKILGAIGLIACGVKKIKNRGVKTLD